MKKFLLAGILLATPAYADSWSDFYAHPMSQTTTIEMRKSWQDRVGDAVHNACRRRSMNTAKRHSVMLHLG